MKPIEQNQDLKGNKEVESIIKRVQKLFNKAESLKKMGELEEANTAAAMANKLLTDYNLSLTDVDKLSKDEKKQQEVTESSELSYKKGTVGSKQRLKLMQTIVDYNYCMLLFRHKLRLMSVCGTPTNIEVCVYLYETLWRLFFSIGKDKYKEFITTCNAWERIGEDTYLRHFLDGACEGLADKYRAERRSQKLELGEKLDGLMVINKGALTAFLGVKYPKLKSKDCINSFGHSDIKQQGYNTGRNANVNPGLKSAPDAKKQLRLN